MLLTYDELLELVERGVILGARRERVNAASIDVTLGRWVWAENPRGGRVDLAAKQAPGMVKIDLLHEPYCLRPGEFILAQTREEFHLPVDVAGEFRLKSSGARAGLDQALAVWCDPGWTGSVLTLELRNNLQHHHLLLREGMPIGHNDKLSKATQPESASYAVRGQYNGDREAQPSRGIR